MRSFLMVIVIVTCFGAGLKLPHANLSYCERAQVSAVHRGYTVGTAQYNVYVGNYGRGCVLDTRTGKWSAE